MSRSPEPIAVADCTHCGERDHETLAVQWYDGGRPRCGFCGLSLTRRVASSTRVKSYRAIKDAFRKSCEKPKVAKTKDPVKEQS